MAKELKLPARATKLIDELESAAESYGNDTRSSREQDVAAARVVETARQKLERYIAGLIDKAKPKS